MVHLILKVKILNPFCNDVNFNRWFIGQLAFLRKAFLLFLPQF